ncbi:MAG: hypothetical protein JWP09_773 [Candidatus Taylorbacteria bacterium]|nr:hypothetical protein [Candidatus Taylorbacteria bacterium]
MFGNVEIKKRSRHRAVIFESDSEFIQDFFNSSRPSDSARCSSSFSPFIKRILRACLSGGGTLSKFGYIRIASSTSSMLLGLNVAPKIFWSVANSCTLMMSLARFPAARLSALTCSSLGSSDACTWGAEMCK